MSKELIERLNTVREAMEAGVDDWPIASQIWEYKQAVARIEELEKTVEFQKAAWTAERDELLADNARLREALETISWLGILHIVNGSPHWIFPLSVKDRADAALAAKEPE